MANVETHYGNTMYKEIKITVCLKKEAAMLIQNVEYYIEVN